MDGNYIAGFCFIVAGGVVLLFGDRVVQKEGGVILRLFSWPISYASFIKWPIGFALVGVGFWFFLHGVRP